MTAPSRTATPSFSRPFRVEDAREKAVEVTISAEPAECAALAAEVGVPAIHAFGARFEIAPGRRGRVDVRGTVTARLTQVCVVSLDEFDTEIEEEVEVVFAPEAEAMGAAARYAARPEEDAAEAGVEEPPDPIVDGHIDLGVLATEFFVLGLDPYPRKPGVAFEPAEARTPDGGDESPFAALAQLKGKGRQEPGT